MDLNTAVWYTVGLVLILMVLQILSVPFQVFTKVLFSSLGGGVALWLLNLFGGPVGFHVGLNPASAAIVGMLGVPGVLGLGVIRLILG